MSKTRTSREYKSETLGGKFDIFPSDFRRSHFDTRTRSSPSCPIDGEIMGQFTYNEDKTEAKVNFQAHKFPYTASVYYQCNVRLCVKHGGGCSNTVIVIIVSSYYYGAIQRLSSK